MRKIKIEKWTVEYPTFKNGNLIGREKREETLLTALNTLISGRSPQEVPRGIELFRTNMRIAEAFEKAENTGILELEEGDYEFLKKIIEKDIPSTWAMNLDIAKAVNIFLEVKKEKE